MNFIVEIMYRQTGLLPLNAKESSHFADGQTFKIIFNRVAKVKNTTNSFNQMILTANS